MKKSDDYHMNVGGASMILLLVVFALTVFAALSVRASFHEMKLAEKTKDAVQEYYAIDKAATEKMVAIEKAYKEYTVQSMAGGRIEPFRFEGAEVSEDDSGNCVYVKYKVGSDVSEKSLNVTLRFAAKTEPDIMQWAMSEGEHGDYGKGNGGDIWDGELIIED